MKLAMCVCICVHTIPPSPAVINMNGYVYILSKNKCKWVTHPKYKEITQIELWTFTCIIGVKTNWHVMEGVAQETYPLRFTKRFLYTEVNVELQL